MPNPWPPKGFRFCETCDGRGFPKGKPEQSCPTCQGTCVIPDRSSGNQNTRKRKK